MRALGARSAVLAGSFACGCLNPSTYSTPRTVPAREVAVTAALEGFDLRTRAPSAPEGQRSASPLPPTIIVRAGLGEQTDIGIASFNLASFGLDVKHTLVRGDVDLAIDPAVQVQPFTVEDNRRDEAMLAAHLPILLGLNLSPDVSIVATAGVTFVPTGPATARDILVLEGVGHDEKVLARGGLGLDFRVTQSMAIHPEVTLLRGFDYDTTLWIAGMGVTTGRLPSFDP